MASNTRLLSEVFPGGRGAPSFMQTRALCDVSPLICDKCLPLCACPLLHTGWPAPYLMLPGRQETTVRLSVTGDSNFNYLRQECLWMILSASYTGSLFHPVFLPLSPSFPFFMLCSIALFVYFCFRFFVSFFVHVFSSFLFRIFNSFVSFFS